MRWEALFEDLEAQLDAAHAADRASEVADRTRVERATVALVDRLRAAHGSRVVLRASETTTVTGELVDVADQWVLLADGPRRMLVPTAAVGWVGGLLLHAAPNDGTVVRRLTLGHALRALARDRAVVRVQARGIELVGRVERVGADHLDLGVVTDTGRPGEGWTVSFASLEVVRSG